MTDPINPSSATSPWDKSWVKYTAVFFLYFLLTFLGMLPDVMHFFTKWIGWFDDPSNCYRVWWFSEIIYGGREGSIWFLEDLLYPHGIPTMMQSNGVGKELIVALLGGGKVPWLAGNLISFSTPITVGLVGFAASMRLLRGAFIPALVAGWFIAWNGTFFSFKITAWMASAEGLVAFMFCLLMMRSRSSIKWGIFAGIAAGVACWFQLQQLVYIVLFSIIYLIDRGIRKDWKRASWIFLAGGIALVITAPLLIATWHSYGGSLDKMSGDNSRLAFYLWRNHLTQFIFPPDTSIPLGWTEKLLAPLGHEPHPHPYLGWVVIILAFIGWRSKRRGTGFLAVMFAVCWTLSLGPAISLFSMPNEPAPLFGPTWIPGPFLLIDRLPLFSSMRVPGRFILPGHIALGFLALFGVLRVLRYNVFKKHPKWRWAAGAAIIALHMLDVNVWPLEFAPRQYSPFFEKVAEQPGDFAILDVPYGRGMHQYMHYGAYHHKKVIWGYGGRLPEEQILPIEHDFRFPGILDVDPRYWNADYEKFAASIVRYKVKYLFLHKLHLYMTEETSKVADQVINVFENKEGWSTQPYIEAPEFIYEDDVLRVYKITEKENHPKVPEGELGEEFFEGGDRRR